MAVFIAVAGGGLIYDYSRTAVHRATSRLSVEPPGVSEDAARAHFAVSEAQAMRRSEYMTAVAARLKDLNAGLVPEPTVLERLLQSEAVPQTTIIELRAEGPERHQLVAALNAWIEVYTASRKEADRQEESESTDDARHAAKVAQKAVEDKRREMESFRRRHGISSIEREENPAAARLKGLQTALNDATAKEVNAEARVKALNDNLTQSKDAVRASDRNAIGNLEMRALDLREKARDLEHDFTPQYLAMDPKYKALKSNLARVEQQIEREKDRSQRAALLEAQEEYAGAQRAAQRIRDQVDGLKQESQAFATRFVELKRLAYELEQLQETQRLAAERLGKFEAARKPSAVRIRVLTAPSALPEPVSPNYTRDAAIALGAGLVLAIAAVWVTDFLRRDPAQADEPVPQSLIQIAYPVLGQQQAGAGAMLPGIAAPMLAPPTARAATTELTPGDISNLWANAPADGRLLLAALFAGIAPEELAQLRWQHFDLKHGSVDIPGASARRLRLPGPLHDQLSSRTAGAPDAPLLADGLGEPLAPAALDGELACIAHDAGLRHPEEVTASAVHFTYAAFLARQGIRMSELTALVGRLHSEITAELMRLIPSGQVKTAADIDLTYPSLRAA
jgi:polysaccharide biosynthesis transport protein